jgi:hypothetical protein
MLLAAVVAMVLAAAVPALAQTVTQGGTGNINVACVQNAVQQNVVENNVAQGNGVAQANQYGDNVIINNSEITNVNAQAIAQECNISVAQVNAVANKNLTVNKAGKVVVVKKHVATATASASAPAKVQYKAAAPTQYQYQAAAVQYQYASASASAASAPAELPPTGGSSLIALGAGVLLVAGGLLARRIVR